MLKRRNMRLLLRINYFILLSLMLLYSSCADDTNPADGTGTRIKNAVLEWHGDYAADGCGYFVILDDETYKPENEDAIGTQFRRAGSMNVIVKYTYENRMLAYYCGGNPSAVTMKSIRIIWIKGN
jgi:hypothetical protein